MRLLPDNSQRRSEANPPRSVGRLPSGVGSHSGSQRGWAGGWGWGSEEVRPRVCRLSGVGFPGGGGGHLPGSGGAGGSRGSSCGLAVGAHAPLRSHASGRRAPRGASVGSPQSLQMTACRPRFLGHRRLTVTDAPPPPLPGGISCALLPGAHSLVGRPSGCESMHRGDAGEGERPGASVRLVRRAEASGSWGSRVPGA